MIYRFYRLLGYKPIRTLPFNDSDFGTSYSEIYLKKGYRIKQITIRGHWDLEDLS